MQLKKWCLLAPSCRLTLTIAMRIMEPPWPAHHLTRGGVVPTRQSTYQDGSQIALHDRQYALESDTGETATTQDANPLAAKTTESARVSRPVQSAGVHKSIPFV